MKQDKGSQENQPRNDTEKFRLYLLIKKLGLDCSVWCLRPDGSVQPFNSKSDRWYSAEEFARIRDTLNHQPGIMMLPEQKPET